MSTQTDGVIVINGSNNNNNELRVNDDEEVDSEVVFPASNPAQVADSADNEMQDDDEDDDDGNDDDSDDDSDENDDSEVYEEDDGHLIRSSLKRHSTQSVEKVAIFSPMEALAAAQKKLELRAVPRRLPCRELEREQLLNQLRSSISHGRSSSSYLSGVPGTGKTATMREVIRSLRQEVKQGKLHDFKFIEINGLRLATPVNAFSRCLQQMSRGQRGRSQALAPTRALEQLNKRFSSPKKSDCYCVILLDEMDEMVDASQSTIYTFFNWTRLANSRVTVVGIANTIDLMDRLHARIQSRIEQANSITFRPYDRDQLATIVESRLSGLFYTAPAGPSPAKQARQSAAQTHPANGGIGPAASNFVELDGSVKQRQQQAEGAGDGLPPPEELSSTPLRFPVFQSDAVSYAARKIASMHGDARRALEVCRKATQLAMKDVVRESDRQTAGTAAWPPLASAPVPGLVTQTHVEQMVQEMFCSQLTPLLQSCSVYQRLFLVSLVKELKMTNSEHARFEQVYGRLEYILNRLQMAPLAVTQALGICSRLGHTRLLDVGTDSNPLWREIQLILPVEEITYAIIDDPICQKAFE